jgi:hypothetical protein
VEIFAPPFISTFCSTSNGNILPFFACREKTKIPISLGNQDFTVFCFSSKWCHQESNRGHKDFQSFALPTELWHQHFYVCNQCFSIAVAKVRKLLELANISAEKIRFLCKKRHFCGKSTDNNLKNLPFSDRNKIGD